MVWVEPITITRAYVYTYVTEYGEEGPPSAPTVQTGNVGEPWVLSLTPPSSAMEQDRRLDKIRIYRTITASTGQATYFFVDDVPKSQTSFTDTYTDEQISTNNQLQSAFWTPPPAGLKGFVAMPNGIMAGWQDNEVWFSEPYRPHAWPAGYQVSVDYPIVGLGIMGQTLIICTTGHPWAATGVRPNVMSLSKIDAFEPCLSRNSIISTPEAVYYASPNGIVAIVPGQVRNMTARLIDPAKWNTFLDPSKLSAVRFNTAYLTYETSGTANAGALIEINDQRISYHVLTSTTGTAGLQTDGWSSAPILLRGGDVFTLDPPDKSNLEPYRWRSKLFQLPKPANLGAMKVAFTVPVGAPTLNPTPSIDPNMALGANMYGIVRVFADGRQVIARELRSSGEEMRLPAGYKASFWQVEIEARVIVHSIELAGSPTELMSV
jgi:hypothetical protein